MKPAAVILLLIGLSASGLAISDFLRAGTNAARGAMNTGGSLMNAGIGGRRPQGRPSELPPIPQPEISPDPEPSEPLAGQMRQSLPDIKPPLPVKDTAQAMGGGNPLMNSALNSARSAVDSATRAGNSAMTTLSSAISLSSIMATIMTNPWVVYFLNMISSMMSNFWYI